MEKISNKEFVIQYVPFKELKKAGFFTKEIRANHYDAIVERFLEYFATTKRQYILNQPTFKLQAHPDFILGTMTPTVNNKGELEQDSFRLSL